MGRKEPLSLWQSACRQASVTLWCLLLYHGLDHIFFFVRLFFSWLADALVHGDMLGKTEYSVENFHQCSWDD